MIGSLYRELGCFNDTKLTKLSTMAELWLRLNKLQFCRCRSTSVKQVTVNIIEINGGQTWPIQLTRSIQVCLVSLTTNVDVFLMFRFGWFFISLSFFLWFGAFFSLVLSAAYLLQKASGLVCVCVCATMWLCRWSRFLLQQKKGWSLGPLSLQSKKEKTPIDMEKMTFDVKIKSAQESARKPKRHLPHSSVAGFYYSAFELHWDHWLSQLQTV